jgi:hypothetical protein
VTPMEGRDAGRRARRAQAGMAIVRADRYISQAPGSTAADLVRNLRRLVKELQDDVDHLVSTGDTK